MTSQFPAKIDDNITLPVAADNSSLVRASAINDLRAAIIAIEGCLGVNPASVYGTIRERFLAIDSLLNVIDSATTDGYVLTWDGALGHWEAKVNFIASGDLSGSNISQNVLKINGATVPAAGSLTTNNILKVSGASATSYGYILNANVDSAAAIDYSKLGSGTQSLSAQQFDSTVDSKGTMRDVQPKNIQTTDATVTTLDSFTIPSNTTLILTVAISAVKSDNSQGAAYLRTAAFRNNAGTVAQIGTTQDGGSLEDDTSWDATIDNSTTTIRIRVTGKAATTIRWSCVSSRLEVVS